MGMLTDFIPFFPRRSEKSRQPRPAYDIDRALQVELHGHPTLEQHRAQNGELVLVTYRQMMSGEKLLSRFLKLNLRRRIVLDKHGAFMLTEALKPGVVLAQVAEKMAGEFGIDLEEAKRGVIQIVRDLMLRDFVFLVRR